MCCHVTFALEHVTYHVLKHTCSYKAWTTRHEARSYNIRSQNHVTVTYEIPLCIVNIVVALVAVYGERLLTWLPGVCNHDFPNSLLAFIERSIFQVWQLYHAPFVSYKWFLECQLKANVIWFIFSSTCSTTFSSSSLFSSASASSST